MLHVKFTTTKTPSRVKSCAHCGGKPEAYMVAIPVANRGGIPAWYHADCFCGAHVAAATVTGDNRGQYNYRTRLYPAAFDESLHAEMLDSRNTAWAFDGNCYESPLYLNGYYHKKLVSIDKHCPEGRCEVDVFDENMNLVGTAFVSWGTKQRDKRGRFVTRDPYKAVQDEVARVKGLYESNAKPKKEKASK